jgi:excisionase family DNA binding protein
MLFVFGLLDVHLWVGKEILSDKEDRHTHRDLVRAQLRSTLVYSVTEAGALLGISRTFADELVARGELPVIRLGRRRLVPKVALLALIESDRPKDTTNDAR